MSSILEELFESRKEKFNEEYYKKYNKSEQKFELMDDIRLIIKHKVKDELLKYKILEKLDKYDSILSEQIENTRLYYYKLGFKDAKMIKKELE